MQEHTSKPLEAVSFCFLGNVGYNVGDSLMGGAAKMGMDIRLAGPKSCWPRQTRIDQAGAYAEQTGARITLTEDAEAAVRGCDFLYTDALAAVRRLLWAQRNSPTRPAPLGSLLISSGELLDALIEVACYAS